MKKTLFLITLTCFSFFKTYAQAVIRITAGTNLQTAIDNATANTTFLVEPGSYGVINVTKRVALIGSGFFLNSFASAGCTDIIFSAGSDNSLITGMSIARDILVGANGITIQRNSIGNAIWVGRISGGDVAVGGTVIKQNYIFHDVLLRYYDYNNYASNTLIKNNIILGTIDFESYSCSGSAVNNTILCNNSCYQTYNSSCSMAMYNNIITSTCNYGTGWSTNNSFGNNLTKISHFDSDATNIKVSNFNNVFVGFPLNSSATIDGRYQLLSASPAKGIGTGGVDAGAFGGSEPYILQGIPIGPNVLSVTAPTGAAAGQTISVQIQAKVQN